MPPPGERESGGRRPFIPTATPISQEQPVALMSHPGYHKQEQQQVKQIGEWATTRCATFDVYLLEQQQSSLLMFHPSNAFDFWCLMSIKGSQDCWPGDRLLALLRNEFTFYIFVKTITVVITEIIKSVFYSVKVFCLR